MTSVPTTHSPLATSSSSLAGKEKTKKTRTRSGCSCCRARKIACVEGEEGPNGKLPCKACVRRKQECTYPRSSATSKTAWREGTHTRRPAPAPSTTVAPHYNESTALDVLALNMVFGSPGSIVEQSPLTGSSDSWSGASPFAVPGQDEYSPLSPYLPRLQTLPSPTPPPGSFYPSGLLPLPAPASPFALPPHAGPSYSAFQSSDLVALLPIESLESSQQPGVSLPLAVTTVVQQPMIAAPPLLRTLALPFLGSTLSSLGEVDRDLMSHLFDQSMATQVVAVSSRPRNHFIQRLLPYLCSLFASAGPNSPEPLFVFHSAMRLSSMHRASKSPGTEVVKYFSAAQKHQRRAMDLWKGRRDLRRSESLWVGQSLLALGDLLSARPVKLDDCSELDSTNSSQMTRQLKDVLAVYATLIALNNPRAKAASPLAPSSSIQVYSGSLPPTIALLEHGDDYIEATFAVSRPMWLLIDRVAVLSSRSRALKFDETTHSATQVMESVSVRAEAEQIVADLGAVWSLSEKWQQNGRPLRVQQGTMMYRGALTVLILCEILSTSTSDPRVEAARNMMLELAAETTLEGVSFGYTWPLMIGAIYTQDLDQRQRFLDAFQSILAVTHHLKATDGAISVVRECWKEFDGQGRYSRGIAPWRTEMQSLGLNVLL